MLDGARRNFRRAVTRFSNPSLPEIAGLYWRALRLQLAARPPRIPHSRVLSDGARTVISLTTIPARARHVRPALLSLLDQTTPADRIMLAYPETSLRGAGPYPDPASLNLPDGIDVVRCSDSGPSTKLLPALSLEPDALIIVADDDVIYPRDFVATLKAAHRREPGTAWGYRGVRLDGKTPFAHLPHLLASGLAAPAPADVLFGTWGYAVTAGMLDRAVHDYSGQDDAVRWVDDIWISGHLARRGVPRKILTSSLFPVESPTVLRAALTSGINRSGANDDAAIKVFAGDWGSPAAATGSGGDDD
ncbi:MAG: hypothetical protein CMJ42_03030 [Phyllobacteriaceae bacterium]|nr:hypothetical protein [Phyllobacteriaceae bacterium]MBA93054.1 hypothetical protein [Phyllobacteriaceae bacterium]